MTRPIYVSLVLVLMYLLWWGDVSHAGEKAPSFSLMQWGTEKQVSLDDFRGQIVVLDFFRASCGVCFRASWEVQVGIQEFYASSSGNPHGIPVRVVAVSSEVAEPVDMSAFIEETGLALVLDDNDGAVLKRYGGTTVPYLVVIDATGAQSDDAAPRVVYRKSGFEGLEKLHDTIDAITGRTEPAGSGPGTRVDRTPGQATSLAAAEADRKITHETSLDIAALVASDVFVTETLAEYHQERPSMEFAMAISYRHIEVDYASEYLDITREKHLTTDRISVQSSAGFNLNETLTLTAECGAYDGYQTYRALWLDEFYRHIFDVLSGYIDNLDGYRKAHPHGYNVSSGLRWEYLPEAGFAEASIAYQHDVVSPGYEIGVPIVRLRDTYDTVSGRLAFENVLTRRLRTLLECRIDNTTDRDARVTLQGALNYALAENWVTRLTVTGSKEEPDFTSKSVSAVLERDWHGIWFVSLFGRYYEDTSEIANAMVSDAAPPPLETYQAGLGVRRQGHRSSFKLVISPCISRYQMQPGRNTAFDQLYKDRDWLSVQVAFMHQF